MDTHGQVIPAYRGDTIALDETGILSWVHFGDLHITTPAAHTMATSSRPSVMQT
jgi:hypothetical protein